MLPIISTYPERSFGSENPHFDNSQVKAAFHMRLFLVVSSSTMDRHYVYIEHTLPSWGEKILFVWSEDEI